MADQDELIIRKLECEELLVLVLVLGLEVNTKAVLEDVGHNNNNADLYLIRMAITW